MVSVPIPRLARSQGLSLLLHGGLVALALLWSSSSQPGARNALSRFVATTPPLLMPRLVLAAETGIGGGGDRSPLPAARGRLPKATPLPFAPATQIPPTRTAPLMVEPSIQAQIEVLLPDVKLPHYGDPLAAGGPLSNGRGRGGGIGDGDGTGIGNLRGSGYGNEPGSGMGFRAVPITAAGLTRPLLVYKTEPEYSEEARKARFQGMVRLDITIGADGGAHDIRVSQPLGMGLDERAVEAVRHWRFRPGLMGGKAIPVAAQVEVYFRLL